jgi:2-amino-4-hydroxy-6-hydroxymethyldihydropteridine diphosphokinase
MRSDQGSEIINEVEIAAVGLGSNIGDKIANTKEALDALDRVPRTRLKQRSRFYRTAPVGKTDQDWFVNAAALVETYLSPREMLEALLELENRMGRVRTEKWGPRLIDLDLLFYSDRIIEEDGLIVPHPFMQERLFVLTPLCDIAPDWRHPVLGRTCRELAEDVKAEGQEVAVLWD